MNSAPRTEAVRTKSYYPFPALVQWVPAVFNSFCAVRSSVLFHLLSSLSRGRRHYCDNNLASAYCFEEGQHTGICVIVITSVFLTTSHFNFMHRGGIYASIHRRVVSNGFLLAACTHIARCRRRQSYASEATHDSGILYVTQLAPDTVSLSWAYCKASVKHPSASASSWSSRRYLSGSKSTLRVDSM